VSKTIDVEKPVPSLGSVYHESSVSSTDPSKSRPFLPMKCLFKNLAAEKLFSLGKQKVIFKQQASVGLFEGQGVGCAVGVFV